MKFEAMLYEKKDNNKVICNLCAHRCLIKDSQNGICKVRKNINGKLYSLVYGDIIASHVDPIEKKPLYHFNPGSSAYSIATIGCNFQCKFCQNWQISQQNNDKAMEESKLGISPEKIVQSALLNGCHTIAYTYTEPTIFFEFAYDTARLAKKAGLKNIFVTNGFMTAEAIEAIKPYLDAANVDLKSFRDAFYKRICKGSLQPVLETIELLHRLGIWLEITTLLIPDENDSEEEINDIAKFISSVGIEIPWHISRFYGAYKYKSRHETQIETLQKAYQIGKKHGLRYVYMGNVPDDKNTLCPNCGEVVIQRSPFGIGKVHLIKGSCPRCQTPIEGIWN